jgi:hypothetical protein
MKGFHACALQQHFTIRTATVTLLHQEIFNSFSRSGSTFHYSCTQDRESSQLFTKLLSDIRLLGKKFHTHDLRCNNKRHIHQNNPVAMTVFFNTYALITARFMIVFPEHLAARAFAGRIRAAAI